jgi:2-polyprenyl-3-methyl-5-hydroxy-6-metoxy-1,4-benzoquinol methylase
MNITNPLYLELKKIGLIKRANIVKHFGETRDSKNIKVLKEKKIGIFFLNKSLDKKKLVNSSWKEITKQKGKIVSNTKVGDKIIKTAHLKSFSNENLLRLNRFKKNLNKKRVLDFGCGWGDFLSLLSKKNNELYGVEHRKECLKILNRSKNFIVKENLDFKNIKFDTITLFHVLEHIHNPIQILKSIKKVLKKSGSIIIEVPSADDILLKFNIKEFNKFTFWSEHLILYNELSIKKLLKHCGFKNIRFIYHQRYNFNNHLGWLIKKKPGGHDFFKNLINNKLKNEYEKFLIKNKLTDTISIIAKK